MIQFSPSGSLNVSADPSELPESVGDNVISSGAMTRCKNLRLSEVGKARTRDGSAKINVSAINTSLWWIEEQAGFRYSFSGTIIYRNEASIQTGLTSAQWVALKYNAFNDVAQNVFALNGTDTKRIQGANVYEWGLDAPSFAPTISAGNGAGLTGVYNFKYTYCRKVNGVLVAESNPSPAPGSAVMVTNKSVLVNITEPTDTQVTHARIYRTLSNGEIWYLDSEIDVGGYDYGYSYDWEASEGYIAGLGFKFTTTNSATTPTAGLVSIESNGSYVFGSSPASAAYKLGSNGVGYITNASGSYAAIASEWLLSGSNSDYEVRATENVGTVTSGTVGSWLALSSNREWIITATSLVVEYNSCELLIEIRLVSTGVVQDSAVITLTAEV